MESGFWPISRNREESMAIEISTEKVVLEDRVVPGRLILSIKALGRDELPVEYLGSTPCCVYLHGRLEVRGDDGDDFILIEGFVVDENTFKRALKVIKKCGNRLMEINLRRANMERRWSGKERFVI